MGNRPFASWTRTFWGIAAVWLAACASDGPTPGRPRLSISDATVALTAHTSGDSAALSVAVASTVGPVKWTATTSAAWLDVTPDSGTTPSVLTIVGRATGLAPGAHTGVVTVTSPDAARAETVFVALAVPPAVLTVSPASVQFSGTTGQSGAATQQISIGTGGAAVTWRASASDSWITMSRTTGAGDGTIAVGFDPSGLAAGSYSGTVTVSSDGASNSPQTVTVRLTLAPPSFTITTLASPTSGGSVAGGGTYTSGATASLTATPASGYALTGWLEDGSVVASSSPYQFVVTRNRTLVAAFNLLPVSISTSSNPANGGTTTGGGSVPAGSSVTVTAVANSGFTFSGWTEAGVTQSTSASYTFVAQVNRALVANFVATAPPPSSFVVSTSANPSAGGTTSGGGSYTGGQTATVIATAAAGYTFASWTDQGAIVSTSATYSFSVAANRSLVANFSATPTIYTISASVSPAATGTVAGGGTYTAGSNASVVATAVSGYVFSNWTENGSVVSSSPTYTFTVTGNRALVANFQQISGAVFTLTTSASPSAGGTTSGDGLYPSGSNATATATPAAGYFFVNWTNSGFVFSVNPSVTFGMTSNTTLVANFSQTNPTFTITAVVTNGVGGSVSGGGTYHRGDNVTLTATPSSGYMFANWFDESSGTTVSTSPTYSFVVTANQTFRATFQSIPPFLNVATSSSPAAGGSTQGGGLFANGSTRSVMAVANNGYAFQSWTENGAVLTTSAVYTFVLTANRNLVANFTALPPSTVSITTAAVPSAGGSTTGSGTYATGASVTVTATPAPGYVFSKWTENGPTVSTSASYTFTADHNHFLEAQFVPVGGWRGPGGR